MSRPLGRSFAGFVTRIAASLPIGRVDPTLSLFEFRRVWIVPPWLQVVLVVAMFVTMVFATHAGFRANGTVLGYAGPGFNALINPIYEELIFRGWILAMLVRRHPNWFAIGVSSLLFGILHLRNIYWLDAGRLAGNVAYAGLVIGPLLGYVTLRCRSCWPAVILHYLNNLGYSWGTTDGARKNVRGHHRQGYSTAPDQGATSATRGDRRA